MLLERNTRWPSLAAILAPLLLLSFGSHTFWQYLNDTRQTVGLADGGYIHPLIAAVGLIATVVVLAALYQRLPQYTRPKSRWLFRIAMAGLILGLIGLLGFFWPAQGWLFAGVGGGFLLPFIALIGLGYYVFTNRVLGVLSFAPLAVAITTIAVSATAAYAAGVDQPIGQLFTLLYLVCWLLLGIGLLLPTEADSGQPVPA